MFASNNSFDLRTLRAARVLRPLKLVSGIPSEFFNVIHCVCENIGSRMHGRNLLSFIHYSFIIIYFICELIAHKSYPSGKMYCFTAI